MNNNFFHNNLLKYLEMYQMPNKEMLGKTKQIQHLLPHFRQRNVGAIFSTKLYCHPERPEKQAYA